MIVDGGISLVGIARRYWPQLTGVFVISVVVVMGNGLLGPRHSQIISQTTVGILVGALSLFLAFRVNEAYGRWWEARILWGALLNDSRSFARQALSMIHPPEEQEEEAVERLKRELIMRQIAYTHALRLHLRRQGDYEVLVPFLPEGELGGLLRSSNVPQSIILKQAERLAEARRRGWLGEYPWVALEETNRRTTDSQGGCERIKNTVFPFAIAHFNAWLVAGLCFVVPFVVVGSDDSGDWVEAIAAAVISSSFVLMERLGHELKNPFENKPNDTPMSAICRTVERDLRSMLAEENIPDALRPIDGVLE